LDEKANEVVNVLRRKWDQAYDNFLTALNNTGQPHVVYILTGQGEERPMRDDRLNLLNENIVQLTQSLTPTDSNLLRELIASKAFDNFDAQWIGSEKTTTRQADRLIAILTRKPNSAFDKFIKALEDSDHGFVADELTKKTINGQVETEFLPGVTEEQRNASERIIIDSINGQSEFKTFLRGNGAPVGASQGSIRVHFTCLNVEGIDTLYRLYITGELLNLFANSFSHVCHQHGIESCAIRISTEEFERCRRQFSESVFMKPSKRSALQYATENLLTKIVVNDNFLERLALDERRIRAVVEAGENNLKVKKLLDIISRQPDDMFSKFIEALENTGQQETATVVKIIEENAAEAESKANRRLSLVSKADRKGSLGAPPSFSEAGCSSSSQEILLVHGQSLNDYGGVCYRQR
jgi:hypothetical protein